ncbi:MAG: hypothetical protein JSS91_07200 [Bacteroidetes bacterium]|nr:hypothetical protein [Bacteroidota bacterium]
MNSKLKSNIFFYLSVILAVWFLLTAWLWTYYINLFFSLPFGLLSLLFWYLGKKVDERKSRYKITLLILMNGVIFSIAALMFFLFFH